MQTILIIDDDAAIGDLEQEVLERAGYAVHARPGSPAGRPRGTRSPPAGRWATPPDTADGRCPYRRAASPPARRCGAGWSAPPGRASCTRGGTRSAAAAGPASPVTAPRWSAPGGFQCGGPARHAASPSAGSAAAVRTSVLHIKRKAPSDRMEPSFFFSAYRFSHKCSSPPDSNCKKKHHPFGWCFFLQSPTGFVACTPAYRKEEGG